MAQKFIRTGENRNCGVCGNEFYVPKWKMSISTKGKFCSKECSYKGRVCKGLFEVGHVDLVPKDKRGHSIETREKMKISFRKSVKRGKDRHDWKGGSQSIRHQEMGRFEYKDWRKAVFARDSYTCQCCGESNIYLHADHVEGWAENELTRYDVDNGKTLCYRCHYKKTFHNKEYNEVLALKWGVPKKYRKEELSFG